MNYFSYYYYGGGTLLFFCFFLLLLIWASITRKKRIRSEHVCFKFYSILEINKLNENKHESSVVSTSAPTYQLSQYQAAKKTVDSIPNTGTQSYQPSQYQAAKGTPICECCRDSCSVICTHKKCNFRNGKSKKKCNSTQLNQNSQETYYSISGEIARHQEKNYRNLQNTKQDNHYWRNWQRIENSIPEKETWGMPGLKVGCTTYPNTFNYNSSEKSAAARITKFI